MIGAFIIVRLSSSRLPQKAILNILDKPMIELLIERVSASRMIDKVVIATSTDVTDDPLEDLASRLNIGCYRGSLENVMERVNKAAEAYSCDTVVELLADNPLVHGDLIDDVIRFYIDGKFDYAATVTKEYPVAKTNPELKFFSIGLRVQIYSQVVAGHYVSYPDYICNDNKHPCSYIFDNPKIFKIGYFEAKDKWAFMNRSELTFAVNYRNNFNLIRDIFEKNYYDDNNFLLQKVYEQLDEDKYMYFLMGNG